MQPIPGMTRVGPAQDAAMKRAAAEAEGSVRSAAQAAKQQSTQVATIERMVIGQIEAWQRDHDAGHLLKAIGLMQGMVGASAGMASSTARAAGAAVMGSTNSWEPEPPQVFGGDDGGIPIGGLADAAQDAIDRAAEFAKSRVRNTTRFVEDTANRATRILEGVAKGVADQAKQGGYSASTGGGAAGGFGGRASGAVPGAPGAAGGGAQGGFGGRASGTIPQR
jgi:hypothetical protein